MYFLEKKNAQVNFIESELFHDEEIGIIHPLLFSAFERAVGTNWWNYPYREKNFDPGSFMETQSKFALVERERQKDDIFLSREGISKPL